MDSENELNIEKEELNKISKIHIKDNLKLLIFKLNFYFHKIKWNQKIMLKKKNQKKLN